MDYSTCQCAALHVWEHSSCGVWLNQLLQGGCDPWFRDFARNGEYSGSVNINVPCTAPGPRNVEASNATKTSFSLSWIPVPDVSAYKVERRSASSTYWESALSGISEISSPPYTTTGLDCETDYYFRVRARGAGDPYTLPFGEPSVEEGPEDTDDCGTNPPPPPTNTPTPTATLTPRPPVLTGLHDRASAIDIDVLRTGKR